MKGVHGGSGVAAMHFDRDGMRLVSVGQDGSAIIWQVNRGHRPRILAASMLVMGGTVGGGPSLSKTVSLDLAPGLGNGGRGMMMDTIASETTATKSSKKGGGHLSSRAFLSDLRPSVCSVAWLQESGLVLGTTSTGILVGMPGEDGEYVCTDILARHTSRIDACDTHPHFKVYATCCGLEHTLNFWSCWNGGGDGGGAGGGGGSSLRKGKGNQAKARARAAGRGKPEQHSAADASGADSATATAVVAGMRQLLFTTHFQCDLQGGDEPVSVAFSPLGNIVAVGMAKHGVVVLLALSLARRAGYFVDFNGSKATQLQVVGQFSTATDLHPDERTGGGDGTATASTRSKRTGRSYHPLQSLGGGGGGTTGYTSGSLAGGMLQNSMASVSVYGGGSRGVARMVPDTIDADSTIHGAYLAKLWRGEVSSATHIVAFAPNGKFLAAAVGNTVHVFDLTKNYELLHAQATAEEDARVGATKSPVKKRAKAKASPSAHMRPVAEFRAPCNKICHVDWCQDSRHVRFETDRHASLYCWDAILQRAVTDPSRFRNIEWHTETCVLSWSAQGIVQSAEFELPHGGAGSGIVVAPPPVPYGSTKRLNGTVALTTTGAGFTKSHLPGQPNNSVGPVPARMYMQKAWTHDLIVSTSAYGTNNIQLFPWPVLPPTVGNDELAVAVSPQNRKEWHSHCHISHLAFSKFDDSHLVSVGGYPSRGTLGGDGTLFQWRVVRPASFAVLVVDATNGMPLEGVDVVLQTTRTVLPSTSTTAMQHANAKRGGHTSNNDNGDHDGSSHGSTPDHGLEDMPLRNYNHVGCGPVEHLLSSAAGTAVHVMDVDYGPRLLGTAHTDDVYHTVSHVMECEPGGSKSCDTVFSLSPRMAVEDHAVRFALSWGNWAPSKTLRCHLVRPGNGAAANSRSSSCSSRSSGDDVVCECEEPLEYGCGGAATFKLQLDNGDSDWYRYIVEKVDSMQPHLRWATSSRPQVVAGNPPVGEDWLSAKLQVYSAPTTTTFGQSKSSPVHLSIYTIFTANRRFILPRYSTAPTSSLYVIIGHTWHVFLPPIGDLPHYFDFDPLTLSLSHFWNTGNKCRRLAARHGTSRLQCSDRGRGLGQWGQRGRHGGRCVDPLGRVRCARTHREDHRDQQAVSGDAR